MLTDRSAAGSALIHDQSRTINTDSDDSGYDHHGRKANNKLMNRRSKNHNHSDSDSDYGVELSNSTLVRPDADNDSDYGVEMTVLKKSTGGGAVSAKSAEKKVKKARKKRSKKSKSERQKYADDGNNAAISADHHDDDDSDSDYGIEQMSLPQQIIE